MDTEKRRKQLRQAQKRFYYSNRDELNKRKREWQRLYLYGLTQEAINQMLVDQNGKCALCGKPLGERWAVDHDHFTNKVRGLLHMSCNARLASVEDAIFKAQAEEYLKRYW